MRSIIVFISLLVVCATAACGGGGSGGEAGRSVVAGAYPAAFAAERVGGDAVEVENLTPPGAEPHDVELSARDVERVRAADVVLLIGGGFQPALEEAAADGSGQVVDLLAGLELRDAVDDGHGHGDEEGEEAQQAEEALDPHVWLDPLRYAEAVERIGAVLDAPTRADDLADELRALHGDFERGLAECERRELVVSHAAFGYLADRYGLEQVAISGLSPETEPTPRALEEVVEQVRESGATTVFFETLVSPRLAETVAREAGAETAVLNPLEGLTEEELAAGEDYFSVMRANLDALRSGLGCR